MSKKATPDGPADEAKAADETKAADEPRAADLLPAAGPAPVDAADVMPADATMGGPVETRKVGIRRVSGITFGNRFLGRARWRPAGNSRAFWRNIEADDPFLAQPALTTDAVLEIYPTQRLARMEGSLPKPQPDVAKAYSPRPDQGEAPVRARQEVKRKPRADGPDQRHTPEPRPAKAPPVKEKKRPRRDPPPPREEVKRPRLVPDPEPEPVEDGPVTPPIERRLPPKPKNTSRTRTGRQRMPSRASQTQQTRQKSAKEIREEKARARSGPVEKKKSLDEYRDFMQTMNFMRDKFEAGEEIPEIIDATQTDDEPVRRPKPKAEAPREVKRKSKTAEPAPKPDPHVSPGGLDRRPPRPKKRETKKEVDRSMPSGGNSGGLDDLFGGGGDRVRIGRRKKPTDPPPDDEG
jgi:hypothetical protein